VPLPRCALIGGETAELPGVYREEELDFAACCVGLVDRAALIDGSRVSAGDSSSASVGRRARERVLARPAGARGEDYDGDDLLAPTRLYLDDVRRCGATTDVRALGHVTGGGIEGNLSRVVPDRLRVAIDWDAWERPPVFQWLGRHVPEGELRRVFNLGIGYCAVVPDPAGRTVIGRIE
jgi:phosphoribosylformylglycinamidine cyclo-ligase